MVNPGTKLWRPPVEVTQFWRPFFCKAIKDYIDQEAGVRGMKQKLLELIQESVWLHTQEFIIVRFYKNKNGAKTAPRAPKVTSTCGRHNLLPGLTTERRPLA